MTWPRFAKAAIAVLAVAWCESAPPAEGATIVPSDYVVAADLHQIDDPSLLYAIAMQESGRYDPHAERLEPWPWALNVDGKGYFFADMTEVWDALAAFLQEQPKHVGISLVQVTWPFNPDILWDPYTALDPATNLSLGARILRDCYDRLGDWWQAVGCYHSPTPKIALAYRQRVHRHWLTLQSAERGRS